MDGVDGACGGGNDGTGEGYDGLSMGVANADGDMGAGFDGLADADLDGSVDGDPIDAPDRRPIEFDRDTLNDSLMLSFDHCGVYDGGQVCYSPGYQLVDAVKGTFSDDVFDPEGSRRPGDTQRLTPKQIELVKKMADHPQRRIFGIHVVNHGHVTLAPVFRKIAEAAGCVRIDQVTPNFFESNELLTELADWNRWVPPFTRKRVPAGYYPKATGTTHIWKQYWQVRHKESRLPFLIPETPAHNHKMIFDRFCNTVLEVSCVTWYYREACDFETRFTIKVVSLPFLDPHDMRWGYLIEPFRRYQKAARLLSEQMLHKLKACPPHPVAVKNRGEILKTVRDEALRRRGGVSVADAQQTPGGVILPSRPAVESVSNGCLMVSGADLYAALQHKPELVSVRIELPPRKR